MKALCWSNHPVLITILFLSFFYAAGLQAGEIHDAVAASNARNDSGETSVLRAHNTAVADPEAGITVGERSHYAQGQESSATIPHPQIVEFTSDNWELKDADVTEHLGRKSLTGYASLKNTVFENGIIEFDVATEHEKRSFPGIIFRLQKEGEYERVYLRPHRAGHYPDAIQYVPAFNGVDAWQLYSGKGFTAGLTLPSNQWVHVRIEVKDTQARVFIGNETQPALVIDDLKHGKSNGTLALTAPRDGSAYFSNFSLTNTDNLKFAPPTSEEPPYGVIADWSLSEPSSGPILRVESYPGKQAIEEMQWTPVKSELSGLIDIARYRKPFPGVLSLVWAKTTIKANAKEPRPVAFGYSDNISIYLNGNPIFRGQGGYMKRDPSFMGIVGSNDTIYLPLEKGDNELMLLVSENYGGWGFMCIDLSVAYQDKNLTKLWEMHDQLTSPESVAYDSDRNVLYVSNFDGQHLSKLSLDGKLLALKWATGLSKPTGLRIWNNKLYAVERAGVAEIDLETGQILKRYPIPDAKFINDLSIDDQGVIYVTDSFQKGIFRIANGKAELWLQSDAIGAPNGILVEKNRLLVGASTDTSIKTVDLVTKQISKFVDLGAGAIMDGLVSDGRGGYLISDYFGRIYHIAQDGQKNLLLNRSRQSQFTADFEYIPEKGILIVPSLFDNRLTEFSYRP